MALRLNPTRGNLRDLADRIEFAQRALEVLDRRQDVLLMEFRDALDQHRFLDRSLSGTFEEAHHRATLARMREGDIALRSAARARADYPVVTRRSRNVMGITVPRLSLHWEGASEAGRGWGFVGTPATVDGTADAYETLLERVVRAAEVKVTVLTLLDALEGTVRRVNALEYKRLPELREAHHEMARRLEERERQELVMRKWVKDHIFADGDRQTSGDLDGDDQARTATREDGQADEDEGRTKRTAVEQSRRS